MKNSIASIQSKLKQIAQQEQKTYQLILIRYFHERLLYRIYLSDYRDNFYLKGGTLLYALERQSSRPTLDIDMLAYRINNNAQTFEHIFKKIGQLQYADDGVEFDTESLRISEITEEKKYVGIRVKIEAKLGNIKQNLQVDIGFGDVIFPKPIEMDYPTLLDMDSPYIKAYSIESVIAEKFEAMISLAEMNSRMKDFYDIFRLLQRQNIQKTVLQEAIKRTFENRQTVCSPKHPIFEIDFAQKPERKKQWQAFLKKSNLDTELDFEFVMQNIQSHLETLYLYVAQK